MIRRAIGLLARERSLWLWAALPFLVTLLTFGAACWFYFEFALDPLVGWIAGALAVEDPAHWYAWLWIGPIRALAWAIRWALVLIFFVVTYMLFTAVGGVVASPFLDSLSLRVEQIVTGAAPEAEGGLGAALASMREEGKRVLVLASAALGFALLGLVPVVGLVSAPLAVVFAAFFLPLEYTGYVLDRRSVPFRERRLWLWSCRGATVPFGLAAFGTFLVPGLNFLALPVLVTAGTLLTLDLFPGRRPGG